MDWNRRHCARHGHVTYEPTDPDLRERLRARTAVGDAWRCLRCGDFVLGEPAGAGPADEAPVVPRGRALRDRLILRVLAVERGVRGLLVLAAGVAVWQFETSQASLRRVFEADLPAAKPLADQLGYDLYSSPVVHTIRSVLAAPTATLAWVTLGLLAYAAVELLEAFGLWRARRWAEYLTVVATAAFLPLEVYELTERVTWLRMAAFVFNVAVVVYLLLAKRLFGLRGGWAAAEAQRHTESLLEVERAALRREAGQGAVPAVAGSDPATG